MKALVSIVSFIALLLVTLPGPLYKYQIMELGTAFTGFRYAVFVGAAALILLAVQVIFMRRSVSLIPATLATLFAVIAIAMPLSMMNKAKSVPAIHDISTDVMNPPEFIAIAPLRKDAPNPITYEGADIAAQQLRAYPELKSLKLSQSQEEIISASKKAIAALGWELVNVNVNTGQIEATDTTFWYGFKDDIVIRIEDKAMQRIVDIRSKSRVGRSDLGKNAQRIHAFITELNTSL
ncbi:DUF1499 domain-containing protein [Pseudoalteromonas sp. MMG010]|uniref:DUF1499 domain-containing protein n=1 Tax=Pseudoalteromonas sp. MMG010 TaxID=2822685 RepID=UPI001B3A436B|nr:DUF1499 domain-containing protein [Pseudoalteromonas sp. MMG010]MBQ4833129.1 DUF1499 domain-containing protein [Pseudoalteromonas sp. MMG010]